MARVWQNGKRGASEAGRNPLALMASMCQKTAAPLP
jgi:hypothetical protein